MSDDEASKAGKSEDEKSTKTMTADTQERTPRQKRRDRKKQKRKQGKAAQKPTYKGATTEIQDHVFVYDPKFRAKYWLKSREAFIDYTGRKYGIDVKKSISNNSETIISVPKPTEYTDDEFKELQKKPYQLEEWRFDNKEYREARKKLRMNLGQLYSKLWGQCDIAMQNKIKANKGYKAANESSDVMGLLFIIDEICGTENESKYYPLQQYLAVKKLYDFKQGNMTLAEYYQEFELLKRLATKSGTAFASAGLVTYVRENSDDTVINDMDIPTEDLKPQQQEAILETATDIYLAAIFIQNADDDRYAIYKQHCHNSYVQGNNEYPLSVVDAYSALDQYKFDPNIYKKQSDDKTTTVAHGFLIEGEQEPEETCYNCGRSGHFAKGCRHKTREDGTPTLREAKRTENGEQTPNSREAEHTESARNLPNSNQDNQETAKREVGINNINVDTDEDTLDELYDDTLRLDDYRVESLDGMSFYNEHQHHTADLRGDDEHPLNKQRGHIRDDWILLDNCSTVNVFSNSDYLSNIRKVQEELHLYTNAGKAIINTKGWLHGIGDVWYHQKGIANILSYNSIAKMKGVNITYDNKRGDDAFYVHDSEGNTLRFVPSIKGLYHCKVNPSSEHILTNTDTSLLNTVAENKTKYSNNDVQRAERARRFQEIAGHLSEEQLTRIVRKNQLVNCPITPRDVKLMKAIFGPSVAGMKGKTVRSSKPAVAPNIIPVPTTIKEHYRDITLGIDIMYVNKIPFLTSISRNIHYGTATPLRNSTNKEITEVVRQLQSFYEKRGFRIQVILADGQFKSIEPQLNELGINLNCVSKDEHVPEIERFHRTIKERCRCVYSSLPYKKLPKRMIAELIRTVTFYINAFPWKGGVSQELSPMAIVTGTAADFNLHFQVPFGSYAQVREPTTNTMRARTTGAIATGPNRNYQGGMRFFSLLTGEILDRSSNDYRICPIPNEVIERVERMSRRSQPGLEFMNREQETIHSEDEMDSDNDPDYTDEGSTSTASSGHSDDETLPATHDDEASTTTHHTIENTGVDEQLVNESDDSEAETDAEDNEQDEVTAELQEATDNDTDMESDDDNSDEDNRSVEQSSYGRKRNVGKLTRPMHNEYEYQYIQFSQQYESILREEEESSRKNQQKAMGAWNKVHFSTIDGHVMVQYNLNAGLKRFGQDGKDATMKELHQMLRRNVFDEIPRDQLTPEDKERALPILLFLTAKRDGTIKGRACADGRKQRLWMQKEDSSSPTIAPEALFYTLVIDALEERDVATCDLPGHFLQTDMDERLILRIDGALAKLLVRIEPNRWKKHLHWYKGRPTIYVLCKKAIYGTLNAALLSYKKLIGHLKEWGFKMNPYEPCCWNKDISGRQMTIVFHVDDLKISHKSADEVTRIIQQLESIYATLDPMTVHRGKIHQYLGMTIDFRKKGEVRISMFDYIRKMIDILPADMIGSKPTAAAEHLFKTSTAPSEKLNSSDSDLFHSLTAMSLYLGKRARPDLQTPTAFLCTGVKAPDIHDWKKLSHMMKYLQSTRYLPLILRSDGKGTAIYIDGSHAVHADMKGHAGAVTTEGSGSVFASSTKNKLNTLSSTETEVVSTGEKLPKFVWYRNFRISQGGNSKEDVLYQDNKSAILLNKNGRMSCGKGSKHIAIRYFFITDRISRKEFRVEYCPTEEMLADYFTKPLQGSLFRKLRNRILGIRESMMGEYIQMYKETMKEFGLTDTDIDKISPQECVAENSRTSQ